MTDRSAALAALRARRRRNGTAGIDAFDAFYQAYVTALLGGMAVLVAAGWLGDEPVHVGEGVLARHGAAWLGLASAVAVAVGLRSGARGGPFSLEAPDVRHVLLAPVDRRHALRSPAVRQLRFLVAVASAAGATGGVLASHQLPGSMHAWLATGALWAALTVALSVGVAWCASGARLRPVLATAGAGGLIGWAALAVAFGSPAPTTALGRVGVLPLQVDPVALVATVAAACGALALGSRLLRDVSVERLARRSSLVVGMRFAATMRDLRTVVVLRRQLTQEGPRSRPWIRIPGTSHLPPVVRRDVRALVRMPAPRALRLAGCVVTAGASAAVLWHGTKAFAVVGGLATFLAALELLEPLAQELDHPHLLDLAPVARGQVLVQHLVVPVIVLVLSGLAVAVPVGLVVGGPTVPTLAVLVALAAAPAAIAGAAGSVLRDSSPGAVAMEELVIPPEAVGMRLLYKTLWPPALAAAGFLPLWAAHAAAIRGEDPLGPASSATVFVVAGAAAYAWWIRSRDEIKGHLGVDPRAADPTPTGA